MRIAVCDDEYSQCSYLKELVGDWARRSAGLVQPNELVQSNGLIKPAELAGHAEAVTVHCFDSAEAFLFACDGKDAFDILLLDIQMKSMDGITLAREIRRGNDRLQMRLMQRGSHEELLADAGGEYARLWNAQAQYYA